MISYASINAWISPPGVCGAGMRGSVGSGVELKFEAGGNGPFTSRCPKLSHFFSTHMGFLGCCWGLGRGYECWIKNGESDE